jgi:hypothetical protein
MVLEGCREASQGPQGEFIGSCQHQPAMGRHYIKHLDGDRHQADGPAVGLLPACRWRERTGHHDRDRQPLDRCGIQLDARRQKAAQWLG